jgi:hypothetical protein
VIDRKGLQGSAAVDLNDAGLMTEPAPAGHLRTERRRSTNYATEPSRFVLPGRSEPLWLVMIAGFGEEPLMLLTDLPLTAAEYQRLKNLVILVTTAAYFAATFLGQQIKLHILCEKLLIVSQRFFGIPPFRFYALDRRDSKNSLPSHLPCVRNTTR